MKDKKQIAASLASLVLLLFFTWMLSGCFYLYMSDEVLEPARPHRNYNREEVILKISEGLKDRYQDLEEDYYHIFLHSSDMDQMYLEAAIRPSIEECHDAVANFRVQATGYIISNEMPEQYTYQYYQAKDICDASEMYFRAVKKKLMRDEFGPVNGTAPGTNGTNGTGPVFENFSEHNIMPDLFSLFD